MCNDKTCGGCIHFHPQPIPKKKVFGYVYKNGRCGLGYHDDTDEGCRIWKGEADKPASVEQRDERKEAEELTGYKNRFTTNPWAQWRKR